MEKRHPPIDTLLPKVDLSKEDKKMQQAIEEFEQALKEQPPG